MKDENKIKMMSYQGNGYIHFTRPPYHENFLCDYHCTDEYKEVRDKEIGEFLKKSDDPICGDCQKHLLGKKHLSWLRVRGIEECENCGDTSLQFQLNGYLCHSCQNFIPHDEEEKEKVLEEIEEGRRKWMEESNNVLE